MKYLKEFLFPIEMIWTTYLMATTVTSFQRPFYNIAHMVNSIEEVEHFLQLGANGLEIDVSFAENGTAVSTFHGSPCDCFRVCDKKENFATYLRYLKEVTTPGNANYKPQLIFVILDLKTTDLPEGNKLAAGRSVAKNLITHLWDGGRSNSVLRILISAVYVSESDVIVGIRQTLQEEGLTHLMDKIGWDISMNEPLDEIEALFRKLGTKNHWQSDGKTNCLVAFRDPRRLKEAIKLRDQSEDSYIDKVYFWTIDLRSLMKESLSYGVDSILTNHPERVLEAIRSPEFQDLYRLATVEDDPWEKANDPEREGPNSQPSSSRFDQVSTIFMDIVNSIRKYFRQVFG